ncbi:MAG: biopolymer transporter ExbD [Planctomycetes bacterium]|nr:biopolymer transporter ExbD [Planctomycetota bacterium]
MGKAIVPLIDLVFLTLGSVLAMMTQMERVTAMPVSLAEVGQGSAVVQHGKFEVLTVSAEGLSLNGKSVTIDQIEERLAGKRVVLRADRKLPVERVWRVMARLHKAGGEVAAEIREEPSTE